MAAKKKNTKNRTSNRKSTRRARAKGAEAKKAEATEAQSPEDLIQDPKAAAARLAELRKQLTPLESKHMMASHAEQAELSLEIDSIESEISAIKNAKKRADQAAAQEIFDTYTKKVEEIVKKAKLDLPPPGYGKVVLFADEEGKNLLVQRNTKSSSGGKAKLTGQARQQAGGKFSVDGLGTFGSPSTAAKAAIKSLDPENKGAVNGWVWWGISDRNSPEGTYEHTYKGETFTLHVS